MKKVVVLMSCAVVALFAACKSTEAEAPVEADSVVVEEAAVEVVDTTVADSTVADTTVAAEVVAE